MTEDFSKIPGQQLRDLARKADRALGSEIDRLQIQDERFRNILNRALAIEAEQLRRKNRGEDD